MFYERSVMSDHPIADTVSLEKKGMKPVGGFKSLDQVAEFLVWQAKDSVSQAILHMKEIGRQDLVPSLEEIRTKLEAVATHAQAEKASD